MSQDYIMNYTNDSAQRYSDVDALSTQGRLGRKRYFVYSVVLPLLIFWGVASFATVASYLPLVGTSMFYLILGVSIVATACILICLTVQRCHDFNKKGYWAIFSLIPLANIIYALIPGTNGLNSYGEVPVPEGRLLKTIFYILLIALAALVIYALITLLNVQLLGSLISF